MASSYLEDRRKVELWRVAWVAGVVFAATVAWLTHEITPARAAGTPGWSLTMTALPTNFAPGTTGDEYILAATNDGNATTGPEAAVVTDNLPPSLNLERITGYDSDTGAALNCASKTSCSTQPIFGRGLVVAPGDTLLVYIKVAVAPNAPSSIVNSATVVGGGALTSAVADTTTAISSSSAPFGIAGFSAQATNANGTLDTQAGSHPYEATTTFALASVGESGDFEPAGALKDVNVQLPAGFVANPLATPQCSQSEFQHPSTLHLTCPIDSQVGQVRLLFPNSGYAEPREEIQPVYNLEPANGHTAELGFYAEAYEAPIVIVARVDSSDDYTVGAAVSDISNGVGGTPPVGLVLSSLTLWGVPAEPSHDAQRGLYCRELDDGTHHYCFGDEGVEPESPVGTAPQGRSSGAPAVPFVTDPGSCREPFATTLSVDSWERPGTYQSVSAPAPEPTGCDAMMFAPLLEVAPEDTEAAEPSGYGVNLQVPQGESSSAPATANLEKAVVTLPPGVSISPSAANGLEGCSDQQIGIGTENPVACPNGSKVGTVTVTTPLLQGQLEGAVYVGDPVPGNVYRIFVTVEGFGVSVRLEGKVHADPNTGQLTTTLEDTPQLPFSDFKLHFFGGPHAALSNPPTCGTVTTTSELTPWSAGPGGTVPATPSSSFQVSFDGHGAACPNPQQFAPTLSAGSQSTQAAAFTPFSLTLSRTDQDQDLETLTVYMPPGLLGMLSKIPLCPEPQAAQGTCGPESLIGQTTVGAGPGPDPFYLGGRVYLTGPYEGAPFGLSVVVPVVAGPYNLGTVVVRAAIAVDRNTAALTIASEPFPRILQGIPVQLRTIAVNVDRPGFVFNPTNCAQAAVDATVASTQGASANVSSPFAAQGCANLPFKPSLTASTQAQTSKANGASLTVKVTQKPGEADIHKVELEIPQSLPTRLTTLQKACAEAQFNANPAGCPAGSVIGAAKAVTPALNVPLTGPAILVSHGGAAFPDVEFVLQGQGVTIILNGKTQIKAGITYSRFETVPDAPVSSFEAMLPEGPYSILGANIPAKAHDSLCGQALTLPTSIVAQNGAVVTQSTKVAVAGCKPTLKIAKTKAKRHALLVTLHTSAAGRVRLSGDDLQTTIKKLAAGVHEVAIKVSGSSGPNNWVRLRATLTVGKQAVSKTTSVRL